MRVKQAAIVDGTGKVWTLPRPARHNNIVHEMHKAGVRYRMENEQGFILDDGSFVDRVQAGQLARAYGQVATIISPTLKLTTEDLW